MGSIRNRFSRTAAALALSLVSQGALAQETSPRAGRLSLPEARAVAVRAVQSGEPALAAEIAQALLEADPNDRVALLALGAALPQLGRPEEGRRAAARAFELGATPAQRYEAARVAAGAAAAGERWFLAEYWLRRALVEAPDDAAEAGALRDARALRARSPWRVDVELSFNPSDNVNGGSESPFNEVEGLPMVGVISVDGRALSGWVATADLRLSYRLHQSERDRTTLSFRAGGRWVTLSEEARDLIEEEGGPDDPSEPGEREEITGSDFGSRSAELRLGHERALSWGVLGGSVALARSWAGDGEPVESFRLGASATVPVGEAQALRFSAYWENRRPTGEDGEPQRRVGAELGWSGALGEAGRLSFGVTRSKVLSEVRNQASETWGLRAGFDLAQPVGPARLGLTVAASRTDYPDYAVIFPVPGGRQDERLSVALEARFADWSYAGFVPVVTIEAARNDSNVSRFDTESLGVGFSFRSSF